MFVFLFFNRLVLLNEVPIAQTRAEMDELIERQKGKRNVLIGYFKGIGSSGKSCLKFF